MTTDRTTAPEALLASTPPEVYDALGTSHDGLTTAEATARLAVTGPNVFAVARRRSVVTWFLHQFVDLFALMLVVAAGFTLLSYALETPRDISEVHLAIAILCVVVLNAIIGFVQEYSAERTAEALQAMVPHIARVRRDGVRGEVPVATLVPGDVVLLEAGDAVSADCRVVEAHELAVDNSALTGESRPVPLIDRPVAASTPPIEARNCVFMGTAIERGAATAVVFATGHKTEFGRIFTLASELKPARSPLQREVAIMAKRVATVAFVLGAVVFVLRAVTTSAPLVESFVFGLGVMVALVPEGLPATMSVSLAVGVRRMARRHALLKQLASVETLGSTTVVCSDKTGTLTRAEMTVQVVWESGRRHQVSGVGYDPHGDVEQPETALQALRIGALCSNARIQAPDNGDYRWRVIGDTTEGAIVVAAAKAGLDLEQLEAQAPRLMEFPFDSERKLMTVVCRTADGRTAMVKGSPQDLLERCVSVDWNGTVGPLTSELCAEINSETDRLSSDVLRVLGVARRLLDVDGDGGTQEEVEQELTFVGLIAMIDPPRADVPAAVQACRTASIRVLMVTGDYGLTAEAIARRVGIFTQAPERVVSGVEMAAMDDAALVDMLATHPELVFARVRPDQKLRLVSKLKALGDVVAVTGDGVNDVAALKVADIGIAMGVAGTDVAREAASMVLLDDSFSSIAAAVERGRSVYQNIRRFLVYVFVSNVGELVPVLAAALVGFPLVPVSALQVLAIDLGSDVLPALALGAEQPEAGLMQRPPRPRSERLFGDVVRRIVFLGLIQAVGATSLFFWKIHGSGLGFDAFTKSDPAYRRAVTIADAAIVVSQFFVSFTIRTDHASVFSVGLFSNRFQVAAGVVGLCFIGALTYVPVMQSVFNTAALSLMDWVLVVACGSLAFIGDELRKAWHRSR